MGRNDLFYSHVVEYPVKLACFYLVLFFFVLIEYLSVEQTFLFYSNIKQYKRYFEAFRRRKIYFLLNCLQTNVFLLVVMSKLKNTDMIALMLNFMLKLLWIYLEQIFPNSQPSIIEQRSLLKRVVRCKRLAPTLFEEIGSFYSYE